MKSSIIIIIAIILSIGLSACKEEKQDYSLGSARISSSKTLDTSSAITQRGLVKRRDEIIEYTEARAGDSAKEFIKQAKNVVVVAETTPPDWLESFLSKLENNNPFLRAILLTSTECSGELRGCRTILGLKASFILVDDKYVLINPLYDASTRGVSYAATDSVLVKAYKNFVLSVLSSKNEK